MSYLGRQPWVDGYALNNLNAHIAVLCFELTLHLLVMYIFPAVDALDFIIVFLP